MLRTGKLLALIFVAFAIRLQAQAGADEGDIENPSEVRDKYLVILCVEREFSSAKQEAERVSMLTGAHFSMNGNVQDPIGASFFPMKENIHRVATTNWISRRRILSVTFLLRNQRHIRNCQRVVTLPSQRSVTRAKRQNRNC